VSQQTLNSSAIRSGGDVTISLGGVTTNLGRIYSVHNVWSTARGGSSLTDTDNILWVGVKSVEVGDPGSGNYVYYIYRSHIQFEIPSNLVRLDEPPQLKIYAKSTTAGARIVPTSMDYGDLYPDSNLGVPMTNWTDTNLWTKTQTASSAKYITAAYHTITGAEQQTITLNDLASYHCCEDGGLRLFYSASPYTTFITIALMEYTYDWSNTAIADGATMISDFDILSDSNPPELILRSPWFNDGGVNDGSGQAQKYNGDFVINAHDPNLDSHHKRVDQVPFGLNVRGPISLRNTGRAYRATKSN
jgi:hypothetical protein